MTESRGLTEDCPEQPTRPGAVVRVIRIVNEKGLHARASAKFVQTVEKFEADVRVMRCGESVGGTSIMGLMSLAAARGTDITVDAIGKDAEAVVAAIDSLVSGRFGEEE
jgi:phosphocarrier protein HPr